MANIEFESEFSEIDDEAEENLMQDYLNDTRAESEQANIRIFDGLRGSYTAEELENIAMYKTAIGLNRDTEAMYKKLEGSLIKMLVKVRRRLKENENALIRHKNQFNAGIYCYLRCGKPYFKDANGFTPPDNDDTIMMRQGQMYDFSQLASVRGWTIKDKTELVTALLEYSKDIKRNEYRSQIARLRKENNKENLLEITRLERLITQLNTKTLAEIALPLDQEYDWEDLANSLDRRHTAQEYRAIWKLFFHPSINKSTWTPTEHSNLMKIAKANDFQDWDLIAQQLNTGRTGYQCFVYLRTNMVNNTNNRKWTNEETEYLIRVIDYFKEQTHIPWAKVASVMDGRTKLQVYNKYTRTLELRKGRFLEEEDIVLMKAYDKYGKDFKKIAEFLPGRSVVQIKVRFNLLTKLRLSVTWSVGEDKKLLQIMANQDSTNSFSNAVAYFPGKDRTTIRSRYVTLTRWMKANPTLDISMAPRRGTRRLAHAIRSCDLKEAIAKLNLRMESELNTKRSAKITSESPESEIEGGIMATLINEIVKDEADKRDAEQIHQSDDSIIPSKQNSSNLHKLLGFLNASLDKSKFEKSKYARVYPDLTNIVPTDSQVKIKCYSKVKKVETVQLESYPDIWSAKNHLQSTSVLPPNYATITGCRVLMKYYSKGEPGEDAVRFGHMFRRNKDLKAALNILKERFNTLFLWPILLSNEEPSEDLGAVKPYVAVEQKQSKQFLPRLTGPTIPLPNASLMKKRRLSTSSDDSDGGKDHSKRRMTDIKNTQAKPQSPRFGMLALDED